MSFIRFSIRRQKAAHGWVAALVVAALAAGWADPVNAAPIPGLFPTGVNGSGGLLAAGAVDPHYSLISSDDPSFPPFNAHVSSPRPAAWLANTAFSQWISPNTVQGSSDFPSGDLAGTYIYETTFNLTGFNPALVSLTGTWADDDIGLIFLNGVYVNGTTNLFGPGVATTFNIPIGSNFVSGVNKLDFIVVNGSVGNTAGGSTGLIVQTISGNGPSIPEPSTVVLAGLGMVGLFVLRLRRGRNG